MLDRQQRLPIRQGRLVFCAVVAVMDFLATHGGLDARRATDVLGNFPPGTAARADPNMIRAGSVEEYSALRDLVMIPSRSTLLEKQPNVLTRHQGRQAAHHRLGGGSINLHLS